MEVQIAAAAATTITQATTTSFMLIQNLQQQRRYRQQGEQNQPRYRYRPPVQYDHFINFRLITMDDVLCYHLMRFTRRDPYLLTLFGTAEAAFSK